MKKNGSKIVNILILFIVTITFIGVTGLNEQVIRQEVKAEMNEQRGQFVSEISVKVDDMKVYGDTLFGVFVKTLRNYSIILTCCLLLINTVVMTLLFRWRIKKEIGILLKLDERIQKVINQKVKK